jgi:crotonobetainyl-CoA:carnitine CoA-transferase CaiB-like acyl-CoA transferase
VIKIENPDGGDDTRKGAGLGAPVDPMARATSS